MIDAARLESLLSRYAGLTIGVLGDFCLDRYLEIDPTIDEISIETGRPVHNVIRVRSQPGAAGTVLNNLVALGVGRLLPIGWCGDDGEGFELQGAFRKLPGVVLDDFGVEPSRCTFTYCKPLLMHAGRPPEELNRLDSKNRLPTPATQEDRLIAAVQRLAPALDALIVMDQAPDANTGVVTERVRDALGELAAAHPQLAVIADSRRGLRTWPALAFKMNGAELAAMFNVAPPTVERARQLAADLARRNHRPVYVSLSEQGIVGAAPNGQTEHVPALPVRGPIDIVGAGDCVMANLATATAAGAELREALELATAASSVVIHQLGTTGAATPDDLRAMIHAVH